jgi:hypothetical protein
MCIHQLSCRVVTSGTFRAICSFVSARDTPCDGNSYIIHVRCILANSKRNLCSLKVVFY